MSTDQHGFVRYSNVETVLGGVVGEVIDFESANPRNYWQAINDPGGCPGVALDAKLFCPPSDHALPLVMVVPGSLGVAVNHEAHAETLLGAGFAVCVLDPFGGRMVESTVAEQTQYSFAASAFDVLALLRVLAAREDVDSSRIGALGHSRGGSAVTIAACRRFADPIIGPDVRLSAVYAAYPWCGHQFADPRVGTTRYRAIIGELDEWCSVQEVQAQAHAIGLTGADASLRVVPGAHHSFDREEPVHLIDDAAVAVTAPTVLIDNDGAMIDSRTGIANPDTVDLDMFQAAFANGHATIGASIGGITGQPELFQKDMLTFFAPLATP